MGIPLPPKIFKTLVPAIKGYAGVAREVKVGPFTKVFTGYFGCTVVQGKGNMIKVLPPARGSGVWFWLRVPFFMRKPANGTFNRNDLYHLRKTFNNLYSWDRRTFVSAPGRSRP